jgi:hypothetical protein
MLVAGVTVRTTAFAQTKNSARSAKLPQNPEPPIQSGVYGFSGAAAPYTDPEGVIGECIWIFDEGDHAQIAKATCAKGDPGKYRVVLKPGRYVLHGPGGIKKLQIKQGEWIKIDSVALLPVAP